MNRVSLGLYKKNFLVGRTTTMKLVGRAFILFQRFVRPFSHYFTDKIQARRIRKILSLKLPQLRLGPNSVVIDLGSNRGIFSLALAKYQSRVICMEPNPYVFASSVKLLRKYRNIHLIQASVTKKSSSQLLFFHRSSYLDPVGFSISASLMRSKYNVNQEYSYPVIGIGLSEILNNFEKIDLIKIDIEGGEIHLLQILEENFQKIQFLLMETHEGKMSEGENEIALFKEFITNQSLGDRWFLDWE